MKKALILGSSGFIGNHLVAYLKERGFYTIGVDIQAIPKGGNKVDRFIQADLRDKESYTLFEIKNMDRVYHLAANMGGADFIFTQKNDVQILQDNLLIQVYFSKWIEEQKPQKVFFSSSACIYPMEQQDGTKDFSLKEEMAYPANPDSAYGWEKLLAEILYKAISKATGTEIYLGRFHNIYGSHCTWKGGREKAPAALCRKVAYAKEGEKIEIYGSGKQKRTFLFIDDCLDAIEKLMESKYYEPINIGSEDVISIYDLAQLIIEISGKNIGISLTEGPIGVEARSSNNAKIKSLLDWEAQISLKEGLQKLYTWILKEIEDEKSIKYMERK